MVSLLYLKHTFNESDELLVARWRENVVCQFFGGIDFYTPNLPCDPAQISRSGKILVEAGGEQLLKTTIETALAIQAVKRTEFERVIVGTTGPEKAVSHPWDARLLEAAREKPVRLAERAGIALKMTYDREGTVLRRQSKIPGALIREITRKLGTVSEQARAKLAPWLQRAQRIRVHASICFMALILYGVMRQRLKTDGHHASPEAALGWLRRMWRQSVSINQGVPISGISTINRGQAEIFSAMSLRKPVPDTQLSLLQWKLLSLF